MHPKLTFRMSSSLKMKFDDVLMLHCEKQIRENEYDILSTFLIMKMHNSAV